MMPLRVCLDARLMTGILGGVEQTIIGLAHGLSQLTDGDEEYLFLAYTDAHAWLTPYLDGPCRIVLGPPTPQLPRWAKLLKPVLPLIRSLWHQVSPILGRRSITLPRSDGTLERTGAILMHFTAPVAFLTNISSLYQVHDLQHRHLPQLFTPRERLARELQYRTFCDQAQTISVTTAWGRQDLIQQYGLSPGKVIVVPWAPALTAYPQPSETDLAATQHKFSLPDKFLFYPAQTWAHKNHIGLLDALARVRDEQHLNIPLVCSGTCNEFFPQIERCMRDWGLASQVMFLGFVSPLELQCLYRLCRGLVFPTKFEGFGMPLLEAFLVGVPAACSNVTCLPELAGDAALLFNPNQPDEMTQSIYRLWTDEPLRQTLIERGRRHVTSFSWKRTARIFRAHYRRLNNCQLTDEDQELLTASNGETVTMHCPTLKELSPPPPHRTGWPWTEASPPSPNTTLGNQPWPQVSIITPSYNQAQFIEETIRSVLLQNYPALEYIIIDGGSTDGTIDVLRHYEGWLRWVSKPDRGQTDAINKGLLMATGDILAYLNSDDMYLPGGIRAIANYFRSHPEIGLVYGECRVIDEQGRELGYLPGHPFNLRRTIERAEFLPQQATFWRREAMEKVGLFDDTLHYAMDYEYFLRVAQSFPVAYLPQPVACFRMQRTSKTVSQSEKHWRETLAVSERYGLKPWTLWYWIRRLRHWGLRVMPEPFQRRVRQRMGRAQDPYLYAQGYR